MNFVILLKEKLLERERKMLGPFFGRLRKGSDIHFTNQHGVLILLLVCLAPNPPLFALPYSNEDNSFTPALESDGKISVEVGGKLALCGTNEKGSIILSVGGGKPPYSFRWNTNETSQNRSNLKAGTYTVWVTDSEGSVHRENIVIQPPTPLILDPLVKKDATCGSANTGYAKIGVKMGRNDFDKDSPPYSVTWSNGLKDIWEADNLAPGTYTVKVADKFNCETSVSFVIKSENPGIIVSEQITNVSCSGEKQGEIILHVSGGEAPYSYTWSNGFTGKDLKEVKEGIYQVSIQDAKGCTFQASYTIQASAGIQMILRDLKEKI